MIAELNDEFGEEIANRILTEVLWIGMTSSMLKASKGIEGDRKETVTVDGNKEKLYFHSRRTQQGTTVYQLEVSLEDGKVVGWKDLE